MNAEAVFSSSEDRTRASRAKAPGEGLPVASGTPVTAAEKACSHQDPVRRDRAVRHIAGKIAESFFAVLFPSDCRICDSPLVNISRLPVCPECLAAMHPIEGSLCVICGERISSPYAVTANGGPRCGLCRRVEPVFARAVAYGSYETGLRELIHLLKYSGVRPAANVLGRMLANAITVLENEFQEPSVALVPVPLYRAKRRERGFNQAELIARAALKNNSCRGRLHLCAGALIRQRETASQIGLTRHQRRENLRGAFAVSNAGLIRGRELLIVDDVYTTGATVSECARVLQRAGAAKIWVATVARTLKESAQHAGVEPLAVDSADEPAQDTMARAVAG
jgi:ComF family protein